MITECPSDETGNSSVAPCSRPMNSACARDRAGSLGKIRRRFPALSLGSLRRQFLQRAGKLPARFLEVPMDGQVFGVPEGRDDLLPSLGVALLESGPHLADGLGREQEAPAWVVEDLASELELASSPRDHLRSGMCLQRLGVKHFHLGAIVGQAR